MLIIREMKAEDAEQAAALEAASFSDPWTAKAFLETLSLDYAYYYVAEETAEEGVQAVFAGAAEKKKCHIIGICGLRNIAGEGEITNVSVDIRYRRKGVAAALLQRVLEKGAKLGIGDFTLEVRNGNLPAIRLYEKFGFKGEGVRRDFYANPREDALIMWKRQAGNGTITTVFADGVHV